MSKLERHKYIKDTILQNGSILISNVSKVLFCSEETVRRDLTELENQGFLKRIHGGAYIENHYEKGVPIHLRATLFADEKNKIANFVVKNFIFNGDTIMLDSSTTCAAIAKHILNLDIQLTIITNSLRISNIFTPINTNVKVICVGGVLEQKNSSFVGEIAVYGISRFIADKSFISSAGISANYGVLDNSITSSSIRKAFIEHSRECFYVADSTKFFASADVITSNLSNIDNIVTTDKLSKSFETALTLSNTEIHYC